MNNFKQTKIINISNGVSMVADILERNDRVIKVVIVDTDLIIMLYKKTPHDKNYSGFAAGIEFSTTGEENV